jgi:peptidyl-prolyl cis-trans isomerase C
MYKKFGLFILLILTLFLGWGGCKKRESSPKPAQSGVPPSAGEMIARVNEEVLTEKDLEAGLPEAEKDFISPEQKRDYVRRWIENQILYQKAKEEKIDQDENIKWRIDQVVRNIIIEGFLEKELKERIKVSEEEVKQYYQENKDKFRCEQDEVRLSHILVKNIAEAGLVGAKLQGGESFDQIAKELSLDEGTKEKGGDIGYVPLSNLPPQFYEVVTKLKTKELSPPIQTDYGVDVVMVTDRKEKGSIKEYEQAKEEVTDSLTFAKQNKELEKLFNELKKSAKIQTFGWAAGISLDEIR